MAHRDPLPIEEMVLAELEPRTRELFGKVRHLEYGCSILRFLNQRGNVLITLEDIAYHLEAKKSPIERDLYALVKLGLVARITVVGVVFFGLVEDVQVRCAVHDLYCWQDYWHARLSEIESIVNGRSVHQAHKAHRIA